MNILRFFPFLLFSLFLFPLSPLLCGWFLVVLMSSVSVRDACVPLAEDLSSCGWTVAVEAPEVGWCFVHVGVVGSVQAGSLLDASETLCGASPIASLVVPESVAESGGTLLL